MRRLFCVVWYNVWVYMANNTGNQIIPDNNGKEYKTEKLNVKAEMFKQFYLMPTSPTFQNVYQSAMRAGYSHLYSSNITVQKPKWWIELTESADFKRAAMLRDAENALHKAVNYEDHDKDRAALKLKAASFISERLGKDKYSVRQEVTGADGRRLFSNETRDGAKMPLATLFKGVQAPE